MTAIRMERATLISTNSMLSILMSRFGRFTKSLATRNRRLVSTLKVNQVLQLQRTV